MIAHFLAIFSEWSEKIEAALEETDTNKKTDAGEGPRDELEYWKLRMRMLTQISEQLRNKNCRTVQDVLTTVSQSEASKHADSTIYLALSNWRSI